MNPRHRPVHAPNLPAPVGPYSPGMGFERLVFVSGQGERTAAEGALTEAGEVLDQTIATKVLPAATFWPAEDYHQDYYIRSAVKYDFYRTACGRDDRIKEVWGKVAKGS